MLPSPNDHPSASGTSLVANKAMNDAWEPLLERYLAHAARYYKTLGKPIKIPGATPEKLAFFAITEQAVWSGHRPQYRTPLGPSSIFVRLQ